MMNIQKILLSNKTIFTIKDLELILGKKTQVVRNFINIHKDLFENIYYGIWAIKSKDYNIFELGTKLRKKSYISFATALQYHGIIYQDYSSMVTIASDNTLNKIIDNKYYSFRKISDDILLNPMGLINKGTYSIASKERSVCDMIYLKSGFYFDNLSGIDFNKLEEISQIYNKRTYLEIKNIMKNAK